ncbi:MAG: hypothetical protein KGJ23_08850 [Euryarchaeota archaeon]|nr:hypothetical protein [Euryarchaeota archaeon]MDE1836712.1 hypothetical protein [Euryarchaeota archaeon]MDE1880259.1 hypothetical protein [Euryarchaeota archaeon]MDE2044682.1 hypothetical protein [Thermoplasmata archaeon]
MSNNIRRYNSLDLGKGAEPMTLTVFAAGTGSGVQLNIGDSYTALSPWQVEELMSTLMHVREGLRGYNATDDGDEYEVNP